MLKLVFRKYILLIVVFIVGLNFVYAQNPLHDKYASNSVLSSGKWIKIKVSDTGIYKLTYDDLINFGISNPKNVQVYGYGGWIMEEDFSKPYVDDLPQVSVWMSKDRASFGKGDYILFYGRGNIKWSYNTQKKEFEQTQNPYSDDNYYFLTESPDGPQLVETKQSLQSQGKVVEAFDDYYLHENELVNLGGTGREFYGENFSLRPSQTFSLQLDGITSDEAIIRYNFVARASATSGKLNVLLNGSEEKSNWTGVVTDYYINANLINDTIRKTNLPSQNTLTLTYAGSSTDRNVYLNYIRVNYKKSLQPYGPVTFFRTADTQANLQYRIKQANASMLVFDVTDNYRVKRVESQLSGGTLVFGASNNEIREYALVDLSKESQFRKPELVGNVKNQNLHAHKPAEMIIIVKPYLRKYAEELAQLHANDSGLKSLIVDPDSIYNEFSSGKPDATAYRRFMKMLYDKAQTDSEKPKYLLLFGGGTFDNKFITRNWSSNAKNSMLLTYQSVESLIETASYVTDDYFGFLEDNEDGGTIAATLDVGIGRIAVRSESEARIAVDKIRKYMSPQNRGIWANNVTFVADDAIAGSENPFNERKHMVQADELATFVSQNHPNFIVNKIYQDSYERVVEPTGARYPEARRALFDKINSGTLFVNYQGHGSSSALSHENLVTKSDIESLRNDKLPLWITATCDFTRFDANDTSAGELTFLNPNGGAIALFTTVRVVFSQQNKQMNTSIMKHIFSKKDGKSLRLGDIMRYAKSEEVLADDIDRLKFMLLGDPALRLAYPEDDYSVKVTEINGLEVGEDDDFSINLEALSNAIIKGQIVDQEGNVVNDFNGELESIVFDAIQNLKTRGNVNGGIDDRIKMDFTDYTNILFRGNNEVKNGEFEISFVVPKDILYTGGKGKMSFLAIEENSNRSAQDSYINYTVGGTNTGSEPETNAPIISKMYLNTEQFKSGDNVNATPVFYAEVSDDSGINLSSLIGHTLAIIVDGRYEYDLRAYFESENNSTKKGVIRFELPEQTKGLHTLEFRVWDVWNNGTSQTFNFNVDTSQDLSSLSFEIWGNPATDRADFVVDNDYSQTGTDIKISVYSMTGRLMWVHNAQGIFNGMTRYTYSWDLSTSGFGKLPSGAYVCVLDTMVNGKTVSRKHQKLLVTGN